MSRISDLFPQLRGRPGHGPVETAAQQEEFLQAAIQVGKIHPDSHAAWRTQLAKAPRATAETIERLAAAPGFAPKPDAVDAALATFGIRRAS
jgi:hypothetical protein